MKQLKIYLVSLLIFLNAVVLLQSQNQDIKTKSQPNIVIILASQLSAGSLSCAGNKDVNTPNIDLLAKKGVIFTNAYCTQPLSKPSHLSMFTGRFPHELGFTTNASSAGTIKVDFLADVLLKKGYKTAYYGNWQLPLNVEQLDKHGFETININLNDEGVVSSVTNYLNTNTLQPFLLVASFSNPSDINNWDKGLETPNNKLPQITDNQTLPELPSNFEVTKNFPSVIKNLNLKLHPEDTINIYNSDRYKQYRWAYYKMVEMLDQRVGQLYKSLENKGLLKNSIIIFTSDLGDALGAHNWRGGQALFEECVKVPFIISGEGKIKSNVVNNEDFLSVGIDLFPTVCDYAGIKKPKILDGLSLLPIVSVDTFGTWREMIMVETEFSVNEKSLGTKARMIRTPSFKYVVYSEGENKEQLFNVINDKGEMQNLMTDYRYESVFRAHQKHLSNWGTLSRDNFPYIEKPKEQSKSNKPAKESKMQKKPKK